MDGDIEIAISEPILSEVLRVLRQKLGWPPYDIHAARQRLSALTLRFEPQVAVNIIEHDPSDNRILECAVESRSQYIVSEDKDLLRIGQFQGIPIVGSADYLNRASKDGSLD